MQATMQTTENIQLVKDAYAAFGRGDVPALLGKMSDDIVWMGVYGAAAHVPTSGTRHGKAAVGHFFQQVAEHMQFSQFEPREFIATDDKVVALGHYKGMTSKQKLFESDFAMIFTINGGRVVKFQEFTDSAALNAAY